MWNATRSLTFPVWRHLSSSAKGYVLDYVGAILLNFDLLTDQQIPKDRQGS